MKNILGTQENLTLYNKAGIVTYKFFKGLYYSYERTYDGNGNTLTYKDSDGSSFETTYDKNGNELTFKNSKGYSRESTYDKNGNELTFKNSDGVSRGFDIPEFTMGQLVEKIGNFKLIK